MSVYKIGMCGLLGCTLLLGSVFASDSFSLVYDSDAGDFIGKGQLWEFSSSTDSVTTKKAYSRDDDQGYQVEVKGFDLNTRLILEPGSQVFAPGMYYPAKRFPFNDTFNGLSISAGGAGCNTSLGGFYIHEFEVDGEKISKAAVDFVQYCESSPSGLYGSLRINSTMANSCDETGCQSVRDRFNAAGDDSPIDVDHVSLDTMVSSLETLDQKIKNKYPLFYEQCLASAANGDSEVFFFLDGDKYLNPNACYGKHVSLLTQVNSILDDVLGPRSMESNERITEAEKKIAYEFITRVISKIDTGIEKLRGAGKLSERIEIALSSIAFVFEFASMGLDLS